MLERDASLDVVDSLHVREACASPGIQQYTVLANGRRLQSGCGIGEGVCARVVVILIPPHEAAKREHRVHTDHSRPRWGNVECSDLRTLVRGPYWLAVWSEVPAGADLPDRTHRWSR